MLMGLISPVEISCSNSLFRMSQAVWASSSPTPMEIPVSDEDWQMRNTLMLCSARRLKILPSTPTIPTMEFPERVIRQVFPIEDMPVTGLSSRPVHTSWMTEPGSSGLKVFFTFMGMFFALTGNSVGGYMTLAPKLQSSIASW